MSGLAKSVRQALREGLLYLPVRACRGITSYCGSVKRQKHQDLDKQVTNSVLQGFNAPLEIILL
jgi:hypothetical protein